MSAAGTGGGGCTRAHARAHLQLPENLRADGRAVGGNKQVHALHDVQKNLVLSIRDALGTPRNGASDSRWRLGHRNKLVRLLHNVLLQNAAVCDLRIAEVDHLVQQLVHNYKIVPNGFLLQLAQVFFEHANEVVQQRE